ncbi:MAG TPA: DUF4912 domain-containing protein [Chthoniobacteraceae bacterium]|nr:DUF4912 domain-containing protein [Chthoniobacteraceae bacterium]
MGNSKTGKSQPKTTNGGEGAKKSGSFEISNEPVIHGKTENDVHKYEAAHEAHGAHETQSDVAAAVLHTAYEELGQLPESYGANDIFLIARDPQWLFTYWDIDWSSYPANAAKDKKVVLKVFSGAGREEAAIEVNPEAKNWYIPVSKPATTYHVEIGYTGAKGKWTSIARSGSATTPADALSAEESAEFATLPFHLTFQRLVEMVKVAMAEGETLVGALSRLQGEGRKLAFAPGKSPNWTPEQRDVLIALLGSEIVDKVGMGSAEIDQLLRKELQKKLHTESASELAAKGWGPGVSSLFSGVGLWGPEVTSLFSGVGASWSAQPFSEKKSREFFMHVNAEVIFYGGTHPDAKVTIDGKPIALNADGTFRYHFKFPDGDYNIPIVAVSPDGVEARSATLSFKRETARKGDVGHTAQPKQLKKPIGKKKK